MQIRALRHLEDTSAKVYSIRVSVSMSFASVRLAERGQGVRTPLKNHKNIEFLSNNSPDPLENHKAAKCTKPTSSETPFKWRFAGGPMMARLEWYLDPLSPHKR